MEQVKNEFLETLIERGKSGVEFDIDEFIAKYSLNNEQFFTEIILPLVNSNILVDDKTKMFEFKCRFQKMFGASNSSQVKFFLNHIALDYVAESTADLYDFEPSQSAYILQKVYSLNKIPGNFQRHGEIAKLIRSENKFDFIAACVYLLDKKIRIAGYLHEGVIKKHSDEQGRIIWSRPDVDEYWIIEYDDYYIGGKVAMVR